MTLRLVAAIPTIIISSLVVSNFISPSKVLGQTPCAAPGGDEVRTFQSQEPDPHTDPSGVNPDPTLRAGQVVGHDISNLLMEKATRAEFIKKYVQKFAEKCPNYNVVISHNGGQVTGNKVAHEHYELNIAFGHSIGYEIYFSPKGQPFKFVRNGDGGFINWAYVGDFTRDDKTLTAK